MKLATDKANGKEYAVKIMNLPELSHQPASDNENTREDIFKEIDILVGMDHENVLNLTEYYEEGGKVRCKSACRLRSCKAYIECFRTGHLSVQSMHGASHVQAPDLMCLLDLDCAAPGLPDH